MEAGEVFYAESGGLISPDIVVLQCYELAYFYHVDPQTFLQQPITRVFRHKMWTEKLTERIRSAQESESSGG